MDRAEEHVGRLLQHLGFEDTKHEPDGNVPPDFSVSDRIAIEVRRLNQNVVQDGQHVGLEEGDIPLLYKMRSVLESLGPPDDAQSWFIFYRFRRPLAPLKTIARDLESLLSTFRSKSPRGRTEATLQSGIEVVIFKAGSEYPQMFLLGGYSDYDSGGWVLAEMDRNIRICLEEKSKKIAPYRSRYDEWWLVLVDHIGFGLDDFDRELFREKVRIEHDWDRVLIVDPRDHTRWFDLGGTADTNHEHGT